MKDWNTYFIEMASLVATKSKDPSTQVGCVIIGPDNEIRSSGYNNFPRNINDNILSRFDRPTKYLWTEHAERNAIYNAARIGTPLKGCRLFLNYTPVLSICCDCARAIVQVGIIEIIGPNVSFSGNMNYWDEKIKVAEEILQESNIITKTIDLNL